MIEKQMKEIVEQLKSLTARLERTIAKAYQVGLLLEHPQENDPHFSTRNEAIDEARRMDDESYDAIAIRSSQDEGGELLAIVYDGGIFVKWE